MRNKLSRGDVIRKCIVVLEGLRRAMSKGNAGLEPEKGAEESFWTDDDVCRELREILREIEAHETEKKRIEEINRLKAQAEKPAEDPGLRDWQKEIMKNDAPPLMLL